MKQISRIKKGPNLSIKKNIEIDLDFEIVQEKIKWAFSNYCGQLLLSM